MTTLDVTGWELHNLLPREGELRIRRGLFSHLTATAGSSFVAGWSIESPSTTEVWHYLIEQATLTSICTIRVVTEDMLGMFTYDLGVLPPDPVFTYSVNANQVFINSPQLSAPVYGLVGGGLTTAIRVPSRNTETTAIDIPAGVSCAFGDRTAIAVGSRVFFSDSSPTSDPRTYVAENDMDLGGQVLDMLVGPDGDLWMFTSSAVRVLAVDALGKGQMVTGALNTIAGVYPSRPRNAAISNGIVATLTARGVMMLTGGNAGQVIPLVTYQGRRWFSPAVEVDDLRTVARLFATTTGFLIAFPGRPFLALLDVRSGVVSWVWTLTKATVGAVGTLRGRDGDDLFVLASRVVEMVGSTDFDGSAVQGVAAGEVTSEASKTGVVRSLTVQTDSAGQTVGVFAGGYAAQSTSAVRARDPVIGTSVWGAAAGQLVGRSLRSTEIGTRVRDGDLSVEVMAMGADRMLGGVDVVVRGQGRARRGQRA